MDGMNETNEMNEENGMNETGIPNPYEAANMSYQRAEEPKKKKNKIPGIIVLALGLLFILGGIAVLLFGGNTTETLETEEPVDIYTATESEQYVYTYLQCMTEAVAYYEAMDNMQFYIALDADWYPSVVCLHVSELEEYQPYIDWLYSESYDNEPEEIMITGYAEPFDDELRELVIEGFNENFGEGYVDAESFEEWFGGYYLQIGQKSEAYAISNLGIFIMVFGIILVIVGGVLYYEKPVETPEYTNGPIVQEEKTALGVIGALLGALLGGLLWATIGALGYVSGWIGILIICFSYTGYKMFAHKADKKGIVLSIVFGVLVVLPATFLSYGWTYYSAVNEGLYGYVNFGRSLMELPAYLTRFDQWGTMLGDVGIGYLCMGIASIYLLLGRKSKKNKNTNL